MYLSKQTLVTRHIVGSFLCKCNVPSQRKRPSQRNRPYALIISPGDWANIIPIIFLSSLRSIQPIMCNYFDVTGLIKHSYHLYPHRYPFIYSWVKRSIIPIIGTSANNSCFSELITTQLREFHMVSPQVVFTLLNRIDTNITLIIYP